MISYRSLRVAHAKRAALSAIGCAVIVAVSPVSPVSPVAATASVSTPAGAGSGAFAWGSDQESTSYNINTPQGNTTANTVVVNQVLRGFWQFTPDGSLQADLQFGTYQKTSDSPLTVSYQINPLARWSDGRPIDCDDVTLTWLANSGATGSQGFSAASTAGYQDMTRPRCTAGARAFTVTYRRPFADWATMFGPGAILPAHIVEQQGGMTETFIDLADTPASTDLAAAINFYNTGWQFAAGNLRRDLMPSSGPYTISSRVPGQSLTLTANPAWWGAPARSQTLVQRHLTSDAQVQALRNSQINAASSSMMDLQPQLDLIDHLKHLGKKVTYSAHDTFNFEQMAFNTATMKDRNLREAFARCLPRQQIVDELIKPVNPRATIQESRFILPFQPQYQDFTRSTGGHSYDRIDLAAARTAMARSGARTPVTVRIGWQKDPQSLSFQRRTRTIAMLQATCNQVGFNIVDAGTPTFFTHQWAARDWDIALFAWTDSPLVTSTDGIYTTSGSLNFTGYSNPQVDAMSTQLDQAPDKNNQLRLLQQIDTLLWQDLATIPLYSFPAILATSPDAKNVEFNPTQAGLTWNADAWRLQS